MSEYILYAVIAAIVIILFFASYVKAPPDRSAIISGLRKNPRQLRGKAGFKVPFFERVDWLNIGVINMNVNANEPIPTNDFINITVDAVAQVSIDTSEQGFQIASKNFLNKRPNEINDMVTESLQGNLREIIGTMTLKEICQDKQKFSAAVKENAQEDMEKLGIVINSFNVQNITDQDGLINDLGIENIEQIKKDASIAKAMAQKEVAIKQAEADNAANQAKVLAEEEMAERNNQLAIKKAGLKQAEDIKKAIADAAYSIQEQEQRKSLEIANQEAEIARREKEIELQAREAEVAEKKLDAEVRKKAEAEKYAAQQKADADLYIRQKQAEAELFEKEKEAQAIKAQGEAEAEAIRAKGIAEAEAIDKKAEAMKKYGQAAMLEMIVGVLPQMAEAIAKPIGAIDKVSIIGGNGNGVNEMSGNVPVLLAQTMETVREATGIDLNEIVKANTYDAKVNHNLNFAGLPEDKTVVKEEVKIVEVPTENK